jgi:hypothetical protein
MKNVGFASLIAGVVTAAMMGLAGPAQADIVTNPVAPHYQVDNHDEINTTNGFADQPF